MPVQINEVIIKAVVESSMPAATGVVPSTGSASASITDQSALAAMVLEIIKEKKER